MVRITRLGTTPNPLSMLVAVSTPSSVNWATMENPTAVGNVACCRTVVLTTLMAKTHARHLLRTVAKAPRVATTTTIATTTGTLTATSLTMVPHNNFNTATQEAPKAVAHRPPRLRSSSPSKACPSTFLRYQAPGMRYGPTPNMNPNGRQPETFRAN